MKAEGRLREFNFRKINVSETEIFSIDVSDDRGNRIIFKMEKSGNTWKIAEQQLPKWIWENEARFHEVIEEELKNNNQ